MVVADLLESSPALSGVAGAGKSSLVKLNGLADQEAPPGTLAGKDQLLESLLSNRLAFGRILPGQVGAVAAGGRLVVVGEQLTELVPAIPGELGDPVGRLGV